MVIAALPIIAVALVAILILLAFTPLQRIIVALVSQLPVVGGWIVQNSVGAIDRAYAQVAGWAVHSIGPLVAVIFLPFFYLDHFNKAAQGSILQTMYALRRVVDNTIPRNLQVAKQFAWDVGQNAMHFAWDVGQQAEHFAWDVGQQAEHFAWDVGQNVTHYAEALFGQAERFAWDVGQNVSHYAEALFGQATTYARQLVGDLETLVRQLNAQALGFAEDAFGRAIDFEQRLYNDAIRFAEREGVLARDWARTLFDQANAFTLATVAAVAIRVTAIERSKCQQFCSPLGDLGQLLQDVEDAALVALLLAMAGEMARDPRGAARSIDSLIGPQVRELTGSLGGEAGFRRVA